MSDEGFHFIDEVEPIRLSVRQNLRISPCFEVGHSRLIGELEPAQELDLHVAFPAREHQAHRITVARHDPLAVLVERDHGVVQRLLDREAAAQGQRIGAFGNDPDCLGVDAGLLQQSGQRNARPLRVGYQSMQRLYARLKRLR